MYSLPSPDRDHLEAVSSSYLGAVLREMGVQDQGKASRLASSSVGVFQQIRKTFSVDDRSHYLFTPRDLTEWALGECRQNVAGQKVVCKMWSSQSSRNKMSTSRYKKIGNFLKTYIYVAITVSLAALRW